MTSADADVGAQTRAKRLRFDRYVLDLDRGCLLLDGNEVALRPKIFAVLQYLIQNPSRLVSKDELVAAVWGNLAITDDALVQSIGDLRRALGDDGPRLIRTVPRRGYRFESDVSSITSVDPPAPSKALVSATSDNDAGSSELIWAQAWTSFGATLTGWRAGLLAAVVVLLATAGLWIGIASLRGGDQIGRNVEAGTKAAIAILPFLNRSDDSAREYFVDGVTQDIINALGRFPALTVMSWNAVLPYRGKSASPGAIARHLMVRYQVEGSVQQAGDRVRVIAQLVNSDGRVLWSARFDEALPDLFALQDKITRQIAGALAMRVTQFEQQRAFAKSTQSLEAYDYLLRARPALQRPARAEVAEARVLLRRAVELDPNYASAYAALAETYHIATVMGWAENPAAVLSRAEEMANKALSLNDSEVRALVILGRIHIFRHEYPQAKAEIDRAIAINPSDALGLAGRGNIMMWSGQTEAAIEALELAQRIDPELNAIDRNALGLAYYLNGRYEEAIEQAKLNLSKTEGAHFSYAVLGAAYAQQGRSEDAARMVAMLRRRDPTFDPTTFGTKFLSPVDLARLRDGFQKAGL
jgi:adenylate cyclase